MKKRKPNRLPPKPRWKKPPQPKNNRPPKERFPKARKPPRSPEPVAGEIVGAVEPAPVVEGEEEAEEEDGSQGAKKKKKGKLKAVIELDPETGLTVARRKRKPGRSKDWVDDGSGEGV